MSWMGGRGHLVAAAPLQSFGTLPRMHRGQQVHDHKTVPHIFRPGHSVHRLPVLWMSVPTLVVTWKCYLCQIHLVSYLLVFKILKEVFKILKEEPGK